LWQKASILAPDEKQALLSVMNALRTTAPLVMEFIAHYERIVSNVLESSD
jgi:hypothetical protein